MKPNRKLKSKKRVKRKEAHLMAFKLIINNECLPPLQVKEIFNSWKECTIAALEISKEIMLSQKDIFVNNNKVATKFVCAEIDTI